MDWIDDGEGKKVQTVAPTSGSWYTGKAMRSNAIPINGPGVVAFGQAGLSLGWCWHKKAVATEKDGTV